MSKIVLLAEDETVLRNLQTRILQKHGYTVISVENGTQALDVLESTQIDIAILDVNMGAGPSGLDVLAKIKDAHPNVRTILSSGDVDEIYSHDKSQQPDVYLAKPFRMTVLIDLL